MIVGSGAKMLDGYPRDAKAEPNEALCDVAWHAVRAFDAAGPLISRFRGLRPHGFLRAAVIDPCLLAFRTMSQTYGGARCGVVARRTGSHAAVGVSSDSSPSRAKTICRPWKRCSKRRYVHMADLSPRLSLQVAGQTR